MDYDERAIFYFTALPGRGYELLENYKFVDIASRILEVCSFDIYCTTH